MGNDGGPVSMVSVPWGEDADDRCARGGNERDRWTQTRPKATLLVQIFALATGRPGREACHSMFPPA